MIIHELLPAAPMRDPGRRLLYLILLLEPLPSNIASENLLNLDENLLVDVLPFVNNSLLLKIHRWLLLLIESILLEIVVDLWLHPMALLDVHIPAAAGTLDLHVVAVGQHVVGPDEVVAEHVRVHLVVHELVLVVVVVLDGILVLLHEVAVHARAQV